MRRAVRVIGLACALMLVAGCLMDDSAAPDEPIRAADFEIEVRALSAEADDGFVVREVVCNVVGLDARGDAVIVTHVETGETREHEIEVFTLTPSSIDIFNYSGVVTIEYVCTMIGFHGDSLHCQVYTRTGRAAPLIGPSVDVAVIKDVEAGGTATCFGVIGAM